MFSGSNNPPPPPPSYDEATGFGGLSNQYNTEYSQPLGQPSVQPAQPALLQLFGQPQTYGQPPTYGNPQTFGQPHSVPKPLTYSQPQAPSQPQSLGQHSSQKPTSAINPPYPTQGGRNKATVTHMTLGQQRQRGWSHTKEEEKMEVGNFLAALVCFPPLGIWAWIELKKGTEAYLRGNDHVAKEHARKATMLSNIAILLGCIIIAIIIISNPSYFTNSNSTYSHP